MRRLCLRLLGLVFVWLCLVALVNAAPQLLPISVAFSLIGGALGLALAVTAGVTGVRLLRLRPSAVRALRAWLVTCAVYGLWVVIGPVPGISPFHTAALAIVAGGLAWGLHRFVSRSLAPT